MKIRKSAWHYRFYTFGFESYYEGRITANLCSYFWRTVWGMFKTLIIFAILSGIVIGLGSIVYQFPFYSSSAVVALVILIVGSHYKWRIPRRDSAKREPGLLRSYLKAKKDKVCPLIEFEE